MEDPIEKMRKALEEAQTMAQLTQFARTSEEARLEKDWKELVAKLRRAFDKVRTEFFGEKYAELPGVQTDPGFILGFKVRDFPNSEFWFWIGLRGRVPVPHARRKPLKSSGARVVYTQLFASKQDFELTDVVEDDVVRTISEAYVNSLPKL